MTKKIQSVELLDDDSLEIVPTEGSKFSIDLARLQKFAEGEEAGGGDDTEGGDDENMSDDGGSKSIADIDWESLTGTADDWGAAAATIQGILAKLTGGGEEGPSEEPATPPGPDAGFKKGAKVQNFDAKTHARLIALESENRETKARMDKQDAEAEAVKFAAEQYDRFKAGRRSTPSDFKDRCESFAKEHGIENAKSTYDQLYEMTPAGPGSDVATSLGVVGDDVSGASETVQAFYGAGRGEEVEKFSRTWSALGGDKSGYTRDEFLKINMGNHDAGTAFVDANTWRDAQERAE